MRLIIAGLSLKTAGNFMRFWTMLEYLKDFLNLNKFKLKLKNNMIYSPPLISFIQNGINIHEQINKQNIFILDGNVRNQQRP